MNTPNEYVVMGRFGASYGIKGWIKIVSYTENAYDIAHYQPWFIENKHHWSPLALEDCKVHGKRIIAKLATYHTPETVRLLTGKKIAVLQSSLPALKKNEYYWNDLVGLSVIDQAGKMLGTVAYLLSTGANDVLIIKNKKEHAIPFLLDKVITAIDLNKKEIHVNWELI